MGNTQNVSITFGVSNPFQIMLVYHDSSIKMDNIRLTSYECIVPMQNFAFLFTRLEPQFAVELISLPLPLSPTQTKAIYINCRAKKFVA